MLKMYYADEHTRCENYQLENNNMLSHRRLRFNEKYEMHASEQFSFIFMLVGSLRLRGEGIDEIAEASNMYSLGYDVNITLHSLSDTSFLLLRFGDPIILCAEIERIRLEQHLPEELPDIPSLPVKEPIRHLAESVIFYLDHKMQCRHLYGLKLGEWFFLMRNFYTKKQNAIFFSPFFRQSNSFEVEVREKAKKVTTVNELADACYMSPKTLTRKFKKVFNTTPKQWLLQQKKTQVMTELLLTQNKKELPEKLGFSSYSHLNYYCIRQFGKSLKEL